MRAKRKTDRYKVFMRKGLVNRNNDDCVEELAGKAKTRPDNPVIEKFLLAFIPIFVAIDPIGLVAIFMGLGTTASHEHRQRQAFLGIFTALCVAVVFIFLGKIIFAALGITVADFQVAGGLILLVLAVRELVGIGPQDRGGGDEFGVVPLG
ncbi:MAG TPA: MarC family protein, partial [Chthoniobacterales bacterium]|nr:MarC family protein [Chthoniobacterales bacterium]